MTASPGQIAYEALAASIAANKPEDKHLPPWEEVRAEAQGWWDSAVKKAIDSDTTEDWLSGLRLLYGHGTFGDALVAMRAGRWVTRVPALARSIVEGRVRCLINNGAIRYEGSLTNALQFLTNEDVLATDWSIADWAEKAVSA